MKIALIGAYPPPYGGVSTSIRQLKYCLEKDGFNVAVVISDKKRANEKNKIYYCSLKSIVPSTNTLFFLRRFKPDVIHINTSGFPSPKLVLLAYLLNIPVVYSEYGERTPIFYNRFSSIKKRAKRWAVRKCSKIVAVSEEIASFIVSLGVERENVSTIPCLFPIEVPIKNNVSSPLEKKIKIVTSGFYGAHYGFKLIPPVALSLKKNGINFSWKIVGYCDEEEQIEIQKTLNDTGLEGDVIFLGALERPEMIHLLCDSHIYVRTKYSDSFGIVIAEAHQLGCHCIFGDNNPYFQKGSRLTKYKTGDVDSLTNKLLEIISQVTLTKPPHVDSSFTIEARANYGAIKRIYEEVVNKQ